jgi:hypothetical protein
MTEDSPASKGPAQSWISTLAAPGLAGISTTVFTADGSTERFQNVGLVLSLCILCAVCVPRERWAMETGEWSTAGAPTWQRRITPHLLGAGAAYVLAALLVGFWHTAAFVAVGLFGAFAALVTRPDEPTTGLSTVQKRTAFALLAVAVALLIPPTLVGDWGPPFLLVDCLVLVGVTVAADGRRGRGEPLGSP